MLIPKIRYLFGERNTRPVFVIGTGRSGTHWLANLLKSHPEIRATVEKKPMFRLSTQIALDASTEELLLPRLLFAYRWQMFLSSPRIYLDKSHPNIWLVERLKSEFPDALFLGIQRNPFATVASMLRHRGVSAWHNRWRDFPVPNRFLGITEELAEHYDELSLATQCAHRWLAHDRRLEELKTAFADCVHLVQYEALARETAETINRLQTFLGLSAPIDLPSVSADSLDKWKQQLTPKQIQQIWDVVGQKQNTHRRLAA